MTARPPPAPFLASDEPRRRGYRIRVDRSVPSFQGGCFLLTSRAYRLQRGPSLERPASSRLWRVVPLRRTVALCGAASAWQVASSQCPQQPGRCLPGPDRPLPPNGPTPSETERSMRQSSSGAWYEPSLKMPAHRERDHMADVAESRHVRVISRVRILKGQPEPGAEIADDRAGH